MISLEHGNKQVRIIYGEIETSNFNAQVYSGSDLSLALFIGNILFPIYRDIDVQGINRYCSARHPNVLCDVEHTVVGDSSFHEITRCG